MNRGTRDPIQANLLREKQKHKMKNNRTPPQDVCPVYGDTLVAYCVDTREYLGLKRVIEYSQKFPDYELKSLTDMKSMMKDMIEDAINHLKKREEKIEKSNIEQRSAESRDKMEGLRARGLQQIGVMREKVFEYIGAFFSDLEHQWHNMFEHFNITQKIKNDVLRQVQIHIREFTDLREDYIKNIEGNQSASFKDLHGVTVKVEDQPEILEQLDTKINRLVSDIKRVSQINLTPKLTFNEKLLDNIRESLCGFAHVSMTSEKDNSEKYGYSTLRVSPPDFYQIDSLRKNMNSNLASVCNISNNKFIPVIAKNRKLLMYEITTSTLKEFPINEVFHIPLQNQILISKINHGVVYISGGHLYKTASPKFFEFHYKQAKFNPLNDMKKARWLHRITQYKKWLFVTGGVTSTKEIPTRECERYNISTGMWESMAPMNHARHSHSITYHEIQSQEGGNNKIPALFAIGGIGPDKSYVETIEIYDLFNNNWRDVTLKNPIISPKSAGLFCTSINPNQILIFGGFKHLTFDRSNNDGGLNKTEAGKRKKKNTKLYDYPYPNGKIWIYNIAEESTRLLDSHHLSYGIFNDGNQIIADSRALYCIGKFNEKVAHVPTNQLLFSEDDNNKMAALKIDSADFSFKDFILLS